jgi:hypothetical protein
MSARGTKPRCGMCRAADHLDRTRPDGTSVCPERRRMEAEWKRREKRERREAGVPAGPCATCKKGPKAVRLVYAGGATSWACRSCAELMRSLNHLVTGKRPEYEPLPTMRVLGR